MAVHNKNSQDNFTAENERKWKSIKSQPRDCQLNSMCDYVCVEQWLCPSR